jgi:hypothetical protein
LNTAGESACVGTGPDCDEETFAYGCDGHELVSCRGGKEARLDCRTLHPDLTCVPDGGTAGAAACDFTGNCADADEATCSSGVIRYCYMGTWHTLDCTEYGYAGCDTDPSGPTPATYCTD